MAEKSSKTKKKKIVATKKPKVDPNKPYGFYEAGEQPPTKQYSRPFTQYKPEKVIAKKPKKKPSKPVSFYKPEEAADLVNNQPEVSKEPTPKSTEIPGENPVKNADAAKTVENSAEAVDETIKQKPPLDGTRPPKLRYQGPKSPEQVQDVDFQKAQKTYESGRPHLFEFEKNAAKNIQDSRIPSKINTSSLDDLMDLYNRFKSSKASDALKPVGKLIGPVATAAEAIDASQNLGTALGSNNLNTYQRLGKALKGTGGAVSAGALATEIASAGALTPVALPVGLAGTGLYGIGEGLEYYGDPARIQQKEQEEKNKNKLTKDFAHFLDTSAPESFKGKLVPTDYVPHQYERDIFRKKRMNEMTDEQLMNFANQINRSPSSARRLQVFAPQGFTAPTKGEIVNQIIERARHFGEDPASVLAQIEHESAGFKLGAESITGAQGLGQMFEGAYEDAKKEDTEGVLGNLNYKDVHGNIANWKKQIDASILYNKAIKKRYNKSGTDQEQRLRYMAGTGNIDLDYLRDQFKQGKIKSSPDTYLKETDKLKEKWQNILNNEEAKNQAIANRTPAEFDSSVETQNDSKKDLVKFLRSSTDEERKEAMDKLFPPQLVLQTTPYEEDLRQKDLARLLHLRNVYQGSKDYKELKDFENAKPIIENQIAEEEKQNQQEQQDQGDQPDIGEDAEKLFKSQAGMDETSVAKLAETQDLANQLRFLNTLQQSFDKIGSGIAGAMSGFKVVPEGKFEALSAQADVIEQQQKERAAMEADDPASQRSEAARNIAKMFLKRIGVEDEKLSMVDGMSEKSIFKVLPQISDMYSVQQRLDLTKSQRQEAASTRTMNQVAARTATIGGPPMTRLKNRLSQAGNIYGTLGIKPADLEKMSPEDIEDKLDEATKIQTVESAMELSNLLSGSGNVAASTMNKLLMNSLYSSGIDIAGYIANRQFPKGQGKYLKDIIKMTARAEQYAKNMIRDYEIQYLSGFRRLADDPTVGSDFKNFIEARGYSLEDLDAKNIQQEKKLSGLDEEARQIIKKSQERLLTNPEDKNAQAILKYYKILD